MEEMIQIQTTTSSKAEAERIAKELLDSKACACIKIVPGVESHYNWKGKLETSSEFLLLINTVTNNFEQVSRMIMSIHTYETPEIIGFEIVKGGAEYLDWVQSETNIATGSEVNKGI